MRAYLKFTTVLLMALANLAFYLLLARTNELVLGTGLSLLVLTFGAATAGVLTHCAMGILPDYMETSTPTNLGENPEDRAIIDAEVERFRKIQQDTARASYEERAFWDPNANGGQGAEETHLVPKGKLYPQMKITPEIEEAFIKASQQMLDNMGTPVWDNVRLRGEWVDFMMGSHLALSIPKEALEQLLSPRRTLNVIADPSVPPGEARMANTETGEVVVTITNIKLEDK